MDLLGGDGGPVSPPQEHEGFFSPIRRRRVEPEVVAPEAAEVGWDDEF